MSRGGGATAAGLFGVARSVTRFGRLQGAQPYHALVSRLGGWPLLQNAKSDAATFEWESLEQQLHTYGVHALVEIIADAHLKTASLRSLARRSFEAPLAFQLTLRPAPLLLGSFRRQQLDEYFARLLEELDADSELTQTAVQEALDFEAELLDVGERVAC